MIFDLFLDLWLPLTNAVFQISKSECKYYTTYNLLELLVKIYPAVCGWGPM